MKYKYIQKVIQQLENFPDLDTGLIEGCSQIEIDQIATLAMPYRLPDAFVEFLTYCGKKIGNYLPLTHFYFSGIKEDNRSLEFTYRSENYFESNLRDTFPRDGFIIASDEETEIWWLKLNDGPNPQVYTYDWDILPDRFSRSHESYSDFFQEQIQKIISGNSPIIPYRIPIYKEEEVTALVQKALEILQEQIGDEIDHSKVGNGKMALISNYKKLWNYYVSVASEKGVGIISSHSLVGLSNNQSDISILNIEPSQKEELSRIDQQLSKIIQQRYE